MKKLLIVGCLFLAGMLSSANYLQAQHTNSLTLADAEKISAAAEARAKQDNWNVVIVIMDSGGNLILLRRMDGTQIGSIDVAQKKAETAVKFRRATKVFEDGVKAGNVHIMSLGVAAVEGGVPLMSGGQVVGSIGISGVTSVQDGIIAAAGAEALK
jgi:glc operon protein GlcG